MKAAHSAVLSAVKKVVSTAAPTAGYWVAPKAANSEMKLVDESAEKLVEHLETTWVEKLAEQSAAWKVAPRVGGKAVNLAE